MSVPYELRKLRTGEGLPNRMALVHPDTGQELGVFYVSEDGRGGYRVKMPDANGRCTVLLPEVFPTMHMAKEAILEAHEPEPE